MTRVLNTPVFILATVYFVVDGVLSHVTQPVTRWIAKKKLFERARLWIISLRPYPSLALFAVPVIILEPAKPLAGYLLGTGHFFAGAVTFITAEVLKLTFVERLFQLNRDKLLSIPAFAWGYQYWRHMMDVVESMEVWRSARRLAANAAHMVRTRWIQHKRAHTRIEATVRYGSMKKRKSKASMDQVLPVIQRAGQILCRPILGGLHHHMSGFDLRQGQPPKQDILGHGDYFVDAERSGSYREWPLPR